jgi:hypothetical protein
MLSYTHGEQIMKTIARQVLTGIALCIMGCTITGCATDRGPLNPSAKLPENKGYLYGRFTFGHQNGVSRLVLVVTEKNSRAQHRIRFSTDAGLNVIDVPPGEYSITDYGSTAMIAFAKEWKDFSYNPPQFGHSFRVDANHVYYIGDYVGSTYLTDAQPVFVGGNRGTMFTFEVTMDACKNNYDTTTLELKTRYPYLRSLPMSSIAISP